MARCSRKGIGAVAAAARIRAANRTRHKGSRDKRRHRRRLRPRQLRRPPSRPTSTSRTRVKARLRAGAKEEKVLSEGLVSAQQPGNSISYSPGNSHGGQGKRKTRQKGPREFVGPMDHSYRAVNGNVADGPPSTIQISSNGHGGYYQDTFAAQPFNAVRDDAPTRIFCFIEDLFFQAKINETSKKLGVKVEFVKGDKDSVSRLTDLAEAERPALVVFDLNNLNAKPLTLIPKFKAKLKKATSIIGFLNHLQGDLKLKAIEAGCDTVMPRSAFSQSLPNLLRRYGLEEEEDNYPQPV